MSNIILIGSVHHDLKGPERLEKMLNRFTPDLVGLEQTPEGATRGWQDHLDLKKQLGELPFKRFYNYEQMERLRLMFNSAYFEDWIPKVYKNKSSSVKLYCLDKQLDESVDKSMSIAEDMWLNSQLASGKKVEELRTPMDMNMQEFIEQGSIVGHQKCVDLKYDQQDIGDFISIYRSELFKTCVLERDERFASQIRKIHSNNSEKVMLVTLGNMHIFGDYIGNTYSLIQDLNPQKFRLKDADYF